MRSGFPSSSSLFAAKVVTATGCFGDFRFDGVDACRLQSAINTTITINPNPDAVPPKPMKNGDISIKNSSELPEN